MSKHISVADDDAYPSSISKPIREPLKKLVTYEIAQLSGSFADMPQALFERAGYVQRFATYV
jgi:hypothetical protein